MEFYLSPSFEYSKLDGASFEDLIDVFEDMWRGYVLKPSELLLSNSNCEVAAMTLLSSYFEAIESFSSGKKSDGKSKEFFVKGFCQVFNSDSNSVEIVAGHFYKNVRCGLAHEGMLNYKVCYSSHGVKSIFATYPKGKNGQLILDKGVTSIIVNPHKIYKAITQHFNRFINDLRLNNDKNLSSNFEIIMRQQLGSQCSDLVAALTEDEFLGKT